MLGWKKPASTTLVFLAQPNSDCNIGVPSNKCNALQSAESPRGYINLHLACCIYLGLLGLNQTEPTEVSNTRPLLNALKMTTMNHFLIKSNDYYCM